MLQAVSSDVLPYPAGRSPASGPARRGGRGSEDGRAISSSRSAGGISLALSTDGAVQPNRGRFPYRHGGSIPPGEGRAAPECLYRGLKGGNGKPRRRDSLLRNHYEAASAFALMASNSAG